MTTSIGRAKAATNQRANTSIAIRKKTAEHIAPLEAAEYLAMKTAMVEQNASCSNCIDFRQARYIATCKMSTKVVRAGNICTHWKEKEKEKEKGIL